jgi:hypothetical protein
MVHHKTPSSVSVKGVLMMSQTITLGGVGKWLLMVLICTVARLMEAVVFVCRNAIEAALRRGEDLAHNMNQYFAFPCEVLLPLLRPHARS